MPQHDAAGAPVRRGRRLVMILIVAVALMLGAVYLSGLGAVPDSTPIYPDPILIPVPSNHTMPV